MKASKSYRVNKAIENLEYGLAVLNKDYVSHFSEPSLDDINKSFNFIKNELEDLIKRNFGKEKSKQ